MRKCTQLGGASSFSGIRGYLMFLNISSTSRWPLATLNSGNFGGGLLGRPFNPARSGDMTEGSSPRPVVLPFASCMKYPSDPSIFGAAGPFPFQNCPVVLLFVDIESLTGADTVLLRPSIPVTPSALYPLGCVGLASPLADCSSALMRIPLFLLQNFPPEFLPSLIPKVEARLNPPEESGRKGSPETASEDGGDCEEGRKDKRFRRPLGRLGDLELGVLGGRGEVSLA